MLELYLTPAAISYLTLFLLTTILTVYLAARALSLGKGPFFQRDKYILALFVSITLLSLLFFLESSLLPPIQVVPFHLQGPAVAILLMALIQFAYHFPIRDEKHKLERRFVFYLTCAYFLWEVKIAIELLYALSKGNVTYRPEVTQYVMVAGFVWVVIVFTRNTIQHWKMAVSRYFLLVLLLPLALAYLTLFRNVNPTLTIYYPMLNSMGLMLTVFLFVLTYLSFQEEPLSLTIKLSGAALTSVLVVFGTIPWLISPAYADQYVSRVAELDHRTIHFRPDGKGGYVADEIPFRWEADLGKRVPYPVLAEVPGYDFDFPFFGKPYQQIFISSSGGIGIGEKFSEANYPNHFTFTPMLFPLVATLLVDTPQGGGVFYHQAPGKAVVTWYKLLPFFNADRGDTYTFQAVLFRDGSIHFSYNGLPDFKYQTDLGPGATAWAIGIKPAQAPPGTANFTNLPLQISSLGAIQDEHLAFRIYIHRFLKPLAVAVVVSSLVFLLGSGLLLNYGLARPLKTLIRGVQNFNMGMRDVSIPIQSNDEVSFLTRSFNTLAGELNSLILDLEQRVSERTKELANTNRQLQSEMEARAAAQAQIVEQQRSLAALEERERMARDLHDGIGQVLGFVNVQAQSAGEALQAGDQQAASQLLARVVEVAQEAHDDVRGYILGLKKEGAVQPPADFFSMLQNFCQHLYHSFDFTTHLNLPQELPLTLADRAVESELFYIVREALTNAYAHSGQKSAYVTLTFDETHLVAVVEDHGAGFNPTPGSGSQKSGHYGLDIMSQRAAQSGGCLQIESSPGSGTRITINIPRHPKAKGNAGLRMLLVDDHPLFLEGMTNLLAKTGMQVVGAAHDGLDALEKARALCPDVILMDIEMPRCDGLKATQLIKSEFPAVKIIMLTVSGEERHLFEALQNGASGYLLKSLNAAELTSLLEELLRDEVSISPVLAAKMLEAFTRHKSPPTQPFENLTPKKRDPRVDSHAAELTERQVEILRLVAQGLQYKQVAAQLGLAEVTIKYHMGEILARLHYNTRQEAIRYARDSHL